MKTKYSSCEHQIRITESQKDVTTGNSYICIVISIYNYSLDLNSCFVALSPLSIVFCKVPQAGNRMAKIYLFEFVITILHDSNL